MPVSAEEWIGLMRREYLATYIPGGGGAVRFVVADDVQLNLVHNHLATEADQAGLTVVAIDAAATKINTLQLVFFAIARVIDWDDLAQRRLEQLVRHAGFAWPNPGRRLPLGVLADANNVAPTLLRRELLRHITDQVWRDRRLAQDFRKAMMALIEARLADDREDLRNGVVDWLHGDLRALRAVRDAQIGARIGIQNARAMLISLCHWLRACDRPGLAVLLDIRRLLRERRDAGDGLVYTPAAVMAAYEAIRQIVDDAEHYAGFFLAVLADARLLDGTAPKRDLGAYDALRLRLSNDVRPLDRDNPLAPLVRVAA